MFTITFSKYNYEQIRKYSINKQYVFNRYADRLNVHHFIRERFYRQKNVYQKNSQNRNDRSRINVTTKLKISKNKSNDQDYTKHKQFDANKKHHEYKSFEKKRQDQQKVYDKNEKTNIVTKNTKNSNQKFI